jgi:hypothetical protein
MIQIYDSIIGNWEKILDLGPFPLLRAVDNLMVKVAVAIWASSTAYSYLLEHVASHLAST